MFYMLDRDLEGPACFTDGLGGDGEALVLEVGHDVVEASVLLSDQVVSGYPAIIEGQLGSVGAVPAHLRQRPAHGEAGGISGYREDGYRPRSPRLSMGPGGDEDQVGGAAVCDEHLRPGDPPTLTVSTRPGPDRGHIRTGIRLRSPR